MVEEKSSTGFWLVFALPFQQGEYNPSQLPSQDDQGLCGAEAPSPLFFVKPFPNRRTTGRHGGIVQKSASLGVASLAQASAAVFLS
ncbi:hypothetical protein VC35_06435 [Pseudomonas fluorescens]|uniref:Uncharacterized protein n=1 Tax=Pseudomonas fluorescens TaxID=294 RepID=A0A0F4TZA8_PSEFL|nr:hypothetical protein VC35_06435 [Pseudomonas fluorescens]